LSSNKVITNNFVERMPGVFFRRSIQDQRLEFITSNCEELTGYTADQWMADRVKFFDVIDPSFRNEYLSVVSQSLLNGTPYCVEYKITHKTRGELWFWEQGYGILVDDKVTAIEGYLTDITAQKLQEIKLQQALTENQKLLQEYKGAVDASAIVSKADPQGIITYVNDQFCKVSGYSVNELVGSTHALVKHPDTSPEIFADLWGTIVSGNTWKGTLKNKTKSGDDYYVSSVISPIIDANGDIVEFISVRFDVTDLVEKDKKIRRQLTDSLTGLANRQRLLEDLGQVTNGALALLNINDFQSVNEYYGFAIGDEVLLHMAKLLLAAAEQYQLMPYRLSGDEFAIFYPHDVSAKKFEELCEEVIAFIANKVVLINEVEFSIGVTLGGSLGETLNLMLHADIALHNAKEQSLPIQIYDLNSPLKRQIDDNIIWLKRIREAIRDGRIEVFAQPIIDVNSPEVCRYECLMRLREGDDYFSPYLFLKAAKHGRLYSSLTKIVFSKACAFFSDREDSFSVNITASDIINPKTSAYLLKTIKEFKVGPQLVFELVESEGIEDSELILQFLDQAKALGCRLAIDDFGTGYSNFEYLLKLDIDYIKIDGSLIRYIDKDENSRLVAEMVVDFARRLGVQTVAEFVHNTGVESCAREIGVDFLQGFLLGEPVPLDSL